MKAVVCHKPVLTYNEETIKKSRKSYRFIRIQDGMLVLVPSCLYQIVVFCLFPSRPIMKLRRLQLRQTDIGTFAASNAMMDTSDY